MISSSQLNQVFNGNVNINPSDLKTLTCESCGHDKFDQVFVIKKIPALLSPTGKEIKLPIPVFECTKCKQVSKEMYPAELEKDSV